MKKIRFVVLVLLLALRIRDSQSIGQTGGLPTNNASVMATPSGTSLSIMKTGDISSHSSSMETGTINSSSVTSSLKNVQFGVSSATPSPVKVSTRNTSSVDTPSAIQSTEIVTRKTEPETPVSRTSALGNSVSGTSVSVVSGLGGQPSSFSSFVASSSGSTSHSFTGTVPTATKAEDIPLSSSFRDNSYVTNEATPSSFPKADSKNLSESPSLTLHNSTLLGDSASSTPASGTGETSGVAQELQSFLSLLGIVSGNSSRSMTAEFLPSLMNSGILLQNTLQKLSLVTQDLQLSIHCAADLAAFQTGLQKGEPWTLQMIDAMGKPQAGILLGEKTLVGQYDECRGISQKMNDGVIEGLFCTLQVKMDFSSLGGQLALLSQVLGTVFVDICLPASCRDDVGLLATDVADAFGQKVLGTTCVAPKDPTGDQLFWVTIGIIAFLGLLGACGTAYGVRLKGSDKGATTQSTARTAHSYINMAFNGETHTSGRTTLQEVMVEDKNPSPTVTSSPEPVESGVIRSRGLCSKLLLSFSVLENGKKLLSFERGQGDLSCLHGIRVITITWVILGHCFSAPPGTTANSVGNTAAVMTMIQDWTMTPLVSGTLSVDTFFLLSGCLTSYLFLRQAQKAGGITCRNMILYYVHRFWRLTPLYMMTIMFYAGIMPYLMSGPYDNSQTAAVTNCKKYWWANLLYVNNIVTMKKLCLGWSWYLSDDMQFYVIAPIILVPWVFGKRTIGILICIAMIIVHIVTNSIFITRDHLQYLYGNTQMDYMTEVYFPPWTRVAPFVLGVLLGYMLHSTGCKYKMQRLLVLLGWLSAAGVGLTAVYTQFDNVKDVDKTLHLAWDSNQFAVYEALSRPAWACAVAWVVLACCTDHGGFVNTFLSWRGWAPLSRLTYGAYLFHLITFCVIMGNKIAPFHLSSWTVAELTISVTVLTYMVSFVFSLLVESPTLGLEKALLGGAGNRKH
ncbi:O-acyltransferase like protein-like isoform X1 [Pomacea canaliculata]|uniref:O-acyltransferase like protein-like isoform X1 n=1 Tax=Pomacea canaliculata TaxID=400727 RepID=UPI000D73C113|nr:O-acyltransferase like protein-like isoform X1 [Pomacea canaliculata]